jgi:hypothetical protein
VRRRLLFVLLWVGATAAATAVAAAGVSSVGHHLAGGQAQALSPEDVRERLDTTSTTVAARPAAPILTTAAPKPTTSAPAPRVSVAAPRTSTAAPPSASPPPKRGAVPPTTIPSPTASAGSIATAAATAPPATEAEHEVSSASPPTSCTTQPHSTVGGTVTATFCPGAATLVSAVPASGYWVDTNSSGPEVDVEFQTANGSVRVRASWDNGPRWSVSIDGGGGGDDGGRGGGDHSGSGRG